MYIGSSEGKESRKEGKRKGPTLFLRGFMGGEAAAGTTRKTGKRGVYSLGRQS